MSLPPLRSAAGEPPTYDFGDGRRYAYHDAENHLLVLAFGADTPICAGAPLAIDAEDEMFRMLYFGHGENRGAALAMYFRSGLAIWETCAALLRWRFGGRDGHAGRPTPAPGFTRFDGVEPVKPINLLDFACGHGRVTRFAVHELGAGRVAAAEIEPGAVEFVAREFGVAAHRSSADPAAFDPGSRYDAILVSSLFTHLPRPAFLGWLARLAALLAEDGMLLITLHDLSILPPSVALPADGFEFRPSSESRSLPGEQYGSTWLSETTARELLREALPEATVYRLPRACGGLQDLYVAVTGGRRDLGTPTLPPALAAHVDTAALSTAGRLTIQGWCVDRRGSEPPRSVVLRGAAGELGATADLRPRPDADALFPAERPQARAFRLEVDLPRGMLGNQPLALVAICHDGAEGVIHQGTVDGLLLRSARLGLDSTARELEAARAAWDRETARAAALEADLETARQRPPTVRQCLRAVFRPRR